MPAASAKPLCRSVCLVNMLTLVPVLMLVHACSALRADEHHRADLLNDAQSNSSIKTPSSGVSEVGQSVDETQNSVLLSVDAKVEHMNVLRREINSWRAWFDVKPLNQSEIETRMALVVSEMSG